MFNDVDITLERVKIFQLFVSISWQVFFSQVSAFYSLMPYLKFHCSTFLYYILGFYNHVYEPGECSRYTD
jgi:hypothetical protein